MARSDCDSMSRAAAPSPRRNQISTPASKIIVPPAPYLPDLGGHILQIGPVFPHPERRMVAETPLSFFPSNGRDARLLLTLVHAGFHIHSPIYVKWRSSL